MEREVGTGKRKNRCADRNALRVRIEGENSDNLNHLLKGTSRRFPICGNTYPHSRIRPPVGSVPIISSIGMLGRIRDATSDARVLLLGCFILIPFPDISQHVVKPPCIGFQATDIGCLLLIPVPSNSVKCFGCDFRSIGKPAKGARSGCRSPASLFPFFTGRQTEPKTAPPQRGQLVQFLGEFNAFLPSDAIHWVVPVLVHRRI